MSLCFIYEYNIGILHKRDGMMEKAYSLLPGVALNSSVWKTQAGSVFHIMKGGAFPAKGCYIDSGRIGDFQIYNICMNIFYVDTSCFLYLCNVVTSQITQNII